MSTVKQLLEYWPIAVFVAQIVSTFLVLWVDARTGTKIAAALTPLLAQLAESNKEVTALKSQIAAFEIRLAEAESDIDEMPTKADLEKVLGEAKAAHSEAQAANAGIKRIEGYFIAKGVEG